MASLEQFVSSWSSGELHDTKHDSYSLTEAKERRQNGMLRNGVIQSLVSLILAAAPTTRLWAQPTSGQGQTLKLTEGLRSTHLMRYFVSGIAFPDLMFVSADYLDQGTDALVVAGFWDSNWQLAVAAIAWNGFFGPRSSPGQRPK